MLSAQLDVGLNDLNYLLGGAAAEGLRFLVLGDWGGLPYFPFRTYIEQAVADQIGIFAQTNSIDHVLALGDNFYFDGVQDVEDARFQVSSA